MPAEAARARGGRHSASPRPRLRPRLRLRLRLRLSLSLSLSLPLPGKRRTDSSETCKRAKGRFVVAGIPLTRLPRLRARRWENKP